MGTMETVLSMMITVKLKTCLTVITVLLVAQTLVEPAVIATVRTLEVILQLKPPHSQAWKFARDFANLQKVVTVLKLLTSHTPEKVRLVNASPKEQEIVTSSMLLLELKSVLAICRLSNNLDRYNNVSRIIEVFNTE